MLKRQQETQDKMVEKDMSPVEELEDYNQEDIKNKFMTYFLLFFPTVIIITIPGTVNSSIMLSMSIKGILAFYQFVTLKTFVDKHYE